MLLSIDVIKKPLVTEKVTWGMNEQNKYMFEIDTRASKTDVKRAVEELYKVRVEKVNTQVRKGKFKRYRYGLTQESTTKVASVKLREGDRIDLF